MEILSIICCLFLGLNTFGSSAEIRCEVPRDQRLYSPSYYFNGNLKLGEKRSYRCLSEYRQMSNMATCTKDGWKPDPLCADITCKAPNIPNAQPVNPERTHYDVSSRIEYKCLPGFEPQQPIQITCNPEGEWINIRHCVVAAFCSKPLQIVNNAILTETKDGRKYSHGDTLRYECFDGYESKGEAMAKCDGQTWIYPECINKSQCTKLTKNLRFVTLLDEKSLYYNFDILKYKCNKPYDKTSGGTLMCKDEEWIGTIDCTSSICPPPPLIEDGDYNIEDKIGEVITKVSYSCPSYYVLNKQKRFYRCQDGIWETPPKCLKPCELTPQMYEEYNIYPLDDNYVRHSDRSFIHYCKHGWMVGGWRRTYQVTVSCFDGKITIDKKCDTEY